MISKIFQKEKDRQVIILNDKDKASLSSEWKQHKQSLINLKEYLEEELEFWNSLNINDEVSFDINIIRILQLKEDIQELNKMIERYE